MYQLFSEKARRKDLKKPLNLFILTFINKGQKRLKKTRKNAILIVEC